MGRLALLSAVSLASCLAVPPVTNTPAPINAPEVGPSILQPAVAVGELYQVGEVRQFEIRQGGQPIGRSWGRYLGPAGAGTHRFETRIELAVPGRTALHSAGEIVVDDRGHLVGGFERSDGAELTFVRKGDVLQLSDGTRADEITYDPQRTETAFMAHTAIFHSELMLGLRELRVGTASWRLIPLSGGPPTQWSAEVSAAGDDDGSAAINLVTNLGERITVRQRRIVSIEVEDSNLSIVAVAGGAWPEFTVTGPKQLVYAASKTLVLEELEVPGTADAPRLAGELVRRRDAPSPMPGVLFLSSTGQEDRHGFAGPPPVDLGGHEITDALAEAGFAVLRYDERGRGKSESGPLGFLAQVDDARRALGVLVVHPGVDPDRILLVGHGEGGLRALILAAERPRDVHAVALLATPGRPYAEILRAQGEARLAQVPPELRAAARKEQESMLNDILRGEVPPELASQGQWLQEIFAVRPAQLVAGLKVPLLVAQGDKDFEVDPIADANTLVRQARAAKVKVELKRFADLDHLFKRESGISRPDRYLEDRRVDRGFLEGLVGWARGLWPQPR